MFVQEQHLRTALEHIYVCFNLKVPVPRLCLTSTCHVSLLGRVTIQTVGREVQYASRLNKLTLSETKIILTFRLSLYCSGIIMIL